MKPTVRQNVVYIFAGVIVAVTLYVQFGIKVKPVLPEPVPAVAAVTIDPVNGIRPVVASTASSSTTIIPLAGKTIFALNDTWGNDPFAPRSNRRIVRERVGAQSSSLPQVINNWRLGGIIYLPSKPVAYVNDQPVHVGQIIDGALVAEITKSSVILNVRGERKTLTLGKG